jgi:hypothetical protein
MPTSPKDGRAFPPGRRQLKARKSAYLPLHGDDLEDVALR